MDKKTYDCQEIPAVMGVPELAALLDIGRNSAYELVRSGQVKALRGEEKSVSRAMPSSSFWGLTHKRNAIGEWSLRHPYPIERRKINA